eukprot:238726-Amorphochlora_amoeboformis.AAC.1
MALVQRDKRSLPLSVTTCETCFDTGYLPGRLLFACPWMDSAYWQLQRTQHRLCRRLPGWARTLPANENLE